LEEALRKFLRKINHFGRAGQIGIKRNDVPILMPQFDQSMSNGTFLKFLASLILTQLPIIADWLHDALTASQARDLLEINNDHYSRVSTLVANQVSVRDWYVRLTMTNILVKLCARALQEFPEVNASWVEILEMRGILKYPEVNVGIVISTEP
jgi:hypothetical protein